MTTTMIDRGWRVLFAVSLFLGLATAGWAAPAQPNTLTAQEVADGWLLLFDGQTLFGWTPATRANWEVANGAIRASEGEHGLLLTTSQFANYVLKVDVRSPKGTNSGVFLRTLPKPTLDDVTRVCYEVNVGDASEAFPTGSLVKRQRCQTCSDSADWRTLEMTADGGHFVVKLDGRQVVDYTDPKPTLRGPIGLQFRRGLVEFRNVKLKPLGLKSLFNGKDLAGWKTYPEMKTVCSVTPQGWIHVQNGKGQLESAGQYADFVLQLECFVNGEKINSGVFFRSIPGEAMNGYESQIHNGFLDGDRSKPADCGTGGIFRRQNARKVVANDKEWFSKTIVADGNHFAAWVNGYQVTDWTDTRKPHANPRKGLRLEGGTIILQGHDPTTDFFFRNLRIAEMPKK